MADALLELIGISKTYPGVVALDRRQPRGRAAARSLGLIGENGAGKSTLMKILGGVDRSRPPARSGSTASSAPALTVAEAIASRHRLRPPGAQPLRQSRRRRQHLHRPRAAAGGPLRLVDRATLRALVRPLLERARRRLRARHAGRRAVARAAAAGRDRQGAVARRAAGHHGRADLEPDPRRDRPAARASSPSSRPRASASSSSRTA